MNSLLSLLRLRQFSPLLLVLIGASVAVAAYLQGLHFPFISDDIYFIPENHKLSGLPLTELWRLFTEPYNSASEFLPLRDLSFWFDINLFGLNPSAFRLHNIILYVLSLPLVYVVTSNIWRYFRPADSASAPWVAAIVTALFALHPSLVESVVWISGRKYVLPNLFALLAIWLAINAKREHGLSTPHAAATLLAFVAMMLSKASYVAVAPVIALLWLMFWLDMPASNRRRALLLWPLAILLLAGSLLMMFIASSEEREHFYFGAETVVRTLAVLGWLTRLAVSPESRHFFYPVFEDTHFYLMVTLGAAVLAGSVAGAVAMLRKRSLEGFALTAFVLLCMPYMQIIPYAAPSLVQDRFVALALWPIALLIVALSWRLRPAPRTTVLLIIALSWAFQTIERPRDWRNFETLIEADLRSYPGYYMPAAFKIVGMQLANGLIHEASETSNAITDPEFRDIMNRMIQIYYVVHVDAINTGNPQQAMETLKNLFAELKQLPEQAKWNSPINRFWEKRRIVLANEWRFLAANFPDDELVRYNAGLWMLDDRRYKNASVYLRAATESQRLPETMRGQAYKNLGLALIKNGNVAEAEAPLRAALEQAPPDFQAFCLLVAVYKQTGRIVEATRAEIECRNHAPNEKPAP